MAKLCEFGKEIKKRLVDIDRSHEWLIAQVREDTGLYFDRSYLHKIMVGKVTPLKMVSSIRKLLDLSDPVAIS